MHVFCQVPTFLCARTHALEVSILDYLMYLTMALQVTVQLTYLTVQRVLEIHLNLRYPLYFSDRTMRGLNALTR